MELDDNDRCDQAQKPTTREMVLAVLAGMSKPVWKWVVVRMRDNLLKSEEQEFLLKIICQRAVTEAQQSNGGESLPTAIVRVMDEVGVQLEVPE